MKRFIFSIFLSLLTVMHTADSYAYYSAATETASNSFNIGRVYTVSFNANGGSGSMQALRLIEGSDTKLSANAFTREEYTFTSWNTRADGKGTGISAASQLWSLIPQNSTVTLYAQWKAETGSIIESQWNEHVNDDEDENGTADVLELTPGKTVVKDPSLKNRTSKACYAYMLVSVPTVNAKLKGADSKKIQDAVTLNTTAHWKLVSSSASASTSSKSKYVYRYDKTLSAYGTSDNNPYQSSRRADRTTDLLTGITVKDFVSIDKFSGSIDVSAAFVESSVTQTEADSLALSALKAKGYL